MVMQVPITIECVEEEMARRVTALDATDFSQRPAGQSPHTWHESADHLATVRDGSLLQHLVFTATIEDAPNAGLDRDAWGDQAVLALDARILFVYNLRAGSSGADHRTSKAAARAIRKTIMAAWPEVNVELVNAYHPGRVLDGRWLEVEVRFLIFIDASV